MPMFKSVEIPGFCVMDEEKYRSLSVTLHQSLQFSVIKNT